MTITPDVLDGELSLSAAATRLSYLTRKDAESTARTAVAGPTAAPAEAPSPAKAPSPANAPSPADDRAASDQTADTPGNTWADFYAADVGLDSEEALELLALGEAISRKAHEHDSAAVLAARRAGADWSDIALALGVDPVTAWDVHALAFTDHGDLLGNRPAAD